MDNYQENADFFSNLSTVELKTEYDQDLQGLELSVSSLEFCLSNNLADLGALISLN